MLFTDKNTSTEGDVYLAFGANLGSGSGTDFSDMAVDDFRFDEDVITQADVDARYGMIMASLHINTPNPLIQRYIMTNTMILVATRNT